MGMIPSDQTPFFFAAAKDITPMKKTIDELLETQYHIIDILPKQVPKGSPGRYFAVEEYYLDERRFPAVKQKHIDTVLKLYCYRDISLDDDAEMNPAPETIAEAMRKRYVNIRIGEALIVSEPDAAYLTLYHADADLLELAAAISTAEGLFLWKPEQ